MVAPYKADSQLMYLARSRSVALVVTKDSDLIGLGMLTLIYRLVRWNGSDTANCGGSGDAAEVVVLLYLTAGASKILSLRILFTTSCCIAVTLDPPRESI